MLSRRLLCFSILSLVFVFVSACNLETGDWVAPNDRGRLSYNCLANLDGEVRSFISGDLKAEEVSTTMSCVRKALDEFTHIGRGSRKDGFKAEELSDFLNLKFLGESKITPDFLYELMNIKVVIVGGDHEFVTNAEFRKLIELTYFVEEEARRNAPYMKIYRNLVNEEDRKRVGDTRLNAAQAQLTRTAYNLADLLRNPKGIYKMSSLRSLVEQSRAFLRWEDEMESQKTLDEVMEVIEVYKIFSVGSHFKDGEEVIVPADWVPFFGTFAEWFGIYLDYLYRLKDKDVTYGVGLKNFIRVADEAMNLIVSSINNQEGAVLKFEFVNRILKQVQDMGAISEKLRMEQSVQPSFRYFVEKVLRDLSIKLDDAYAEGLRLDHIGELRKEFYIWADGQKYIDDLYLRSGRNELTDLGIYQSSTAPKSITAGEKEMRDMISNIEPFYSGKDNRVLIAGNALAERHGLKFEHNFHSLTRLNVLKIFARLLVRGFAKEPRRAAGLIGINESEAEDFYRIAKDLGQDLEYMDRRKDGVGARFFKEANLFTFSSNGLMQEEEGSDDHLMSLQESIEQLALVYSGSQQRSTVYESSLKVCTAQNNQGSLRLPVDEVFGKVMIPKTCMLENLAKKDYQLFDNLPGMMEFFKILRLPGRYAFFSSVLDISRPPCTDGTMVEFGELATVTTLLHYIDVIFKRYDVDENGILDGWEVMSSYTHFRGFIRPFIAEKLEVDLEDLKESRSKSVFAYLLKNGKEPTAWNILTLKNWEYWHFNEVPGQFDERFECGTFQFRKCNPPDGIRAGRNDILMVLAKLVQSNQNFCPEDPAAIRDAEFKKALQSLSLQPDHDPATMHMNPAQHYLEALRSRKSETQAH